MAGCVASRSRSVIVFAAQSRIFIFILQFFFNYLIPDHNSDAFKPNSSKNGSLCDKVAHHLFDGLADRWDAIYFMHIAEHGYTYENTLVFFPLFPLLIKALTNTLFFPLQYLLSLRNTLHVAALSLNFAAFIFSSYFLYKLGCSIVKQEHLAFRAAQLYCVNPASIFFSAAYSESLFSFFTFSGLLKLQQGNYFKASCLFALSSATRSNGIINTGFILYSYIMHWHRKYSFKRDYTITFASVKGQMKTNLVGFFTFIYEVLCMILWLFVTCSLFLSHQTFSYLVFCHDMRNEFKKSLPKELVGYGNNRGYKMPGYGSVPSWCHSKPPLSYSTIQEHHWNVGLFKYYEIKQLPNFILALPLLVICFSLSISYFKQKTLHCLFLGMVPKFLKKRQEYSKRKVEPSNKDDYPMIHFYQDSCYVYVVQMTVLTCFGVLFMHIQVITRLICSSCPIFYWYIGDRCMTREERIAMKIFSQNTEEETAADKYLRKNSSEIDVGKENYAIGTSEIKDSLNSEVETIYSHKNDSNEESRDEFRLRRKLIEKPCMGDHAEMNEVNKRKMSDCYQTRGSVLKEVFRESEVIDWDKGWFNKFVSIYFHLYLFVGVAAFSNFFPWT